MSKDLVDLNAEELIEGYRRRRFSPVEVVDAVIERAESINPALNAFVLIDADCGRRMARESEARWAKGEPLGLLDGVPLPLKDLLLTKGWPSLKGSHHTSADGSWDQDSPVVARLREAGAVFFAKTTTPEFGWKGLTDSPRFGITRNPWNPQKTPGGSSGGAAVAAACGCGPIAQGGDAGGSIRIPAGFTGVFGIKPTFGRVPAFPPSPFSGLTQHGPMTRTVADAARALTVMAKPDPIDFNGLPYEGEDYLQSTRQPLEPLRIAFSPTLNGAAVDPEVAALVAQAAARFEEMGCRVEQAEPPMKDVYDIIMTYWRAGAAGLFRALGDVDRDLFDPGLRAIAEEGMKLSLADFQAAEKARNEMGSAVRQFHEQYDLLLTPSLPITAFDAGHDVPPKSGMRYWIDWTPFSYPFNLTRQPAASLPCGVASNGLPVGLQIVGPLYQEGRILRSAWNYERNYGFPELPSMN
ncbi:amidase [Limibacillus halophilus]|uniref:Aspartyl-tRNA(Asn)/glutamyl-tRNA(Gln) amidotransferase subunit A n=1 Tax=Limibacillus halophilus TaxID=1579333 RepID=A0A839STN7_9PROT|nr:amidase [Limibacillus halophilus]MBB3065114.1 aspartyl-tRNA(Asn)/glutamyl-tRNA(Gln) amidotransferase subunit A [Limibacillus halophilus]